MRSGEGGVRYYGNRLCIQYKMVAASAEGNVFLYGRVFF